jgi:diguanylate cyclase (GGDEF)-like protein/PAS domain S-box-containing protein
MSGWSTAIARLGIVMLLLAICQPVPAKVLVVGSEEDYPPFAIGETDDTAGGFTVELWKAVAAESKLDYQLRVLPFRQILQQFKEGKIDVLINLAQSDERRQFSAFTVPHVTVHGAFFVRKADAGILPKGKLATEDDFSGKSIIVLNADLAHDYALAKGWRRQLTLVDTAAEGFKLLASGQHDAMLISKLVGMQTLEQLQLSGIQALNVNVGFAQKFSFAVHKDQSELLARLNEGLVLVKSSGAYDALYEKWFGVYEKKDALHDFLIYLALLASAALGIAGYFFYQRQVERRQAERTLRASEERWKFALQGAGEGVWDWNYQTNKVVYSPFWKEMLGYAEPDIGDNFDEWEKRVHPADLPYALADVHNYLEGRTASYANEHRMLCKDGRWKWILSRGMVVSRDADGKPLRLIGTHKDISERKQMEDELKLAAMVYQALGEAIMVADTDNRIIAINPAFTRLTGYTSQEAVGQTTKLLSSGRQDAAFYQRMWYSLDTIGHWSGEIWNRRKNGEEYLEWLSINTIYDESDGVLQRVAMFSDITDKKRAEETIWLQANYDPLTSLPNRRLFQDRLQQEIRKSHRAGLPLALMFLDLDHFKEINDTLGHSMGDILLQEAARRLCSCVRESDTVARLGGDEFTIILAELQDADIVERIVQDILHKLSEPFHLGQEVAYISASIGITLYPNDASEIDDLLKNADQAMYAAKNQGRNRCSYFTPSMQQVAQSRIRLAGDLRGALADNQFLLCYQPIVELATGDIHKAEALIRWRHPKRGLISPADFIPIAEDTGMITEIGNWVFREAARQVMQWRVLHDAQFQISVNMSPVQFHSKSNSAAAWLDHLQKLGLPGQSITVEFTEGLLLDAGSAVTDRLLAFREAGIQMALDDFGTGYSSLSYLKKFDIDYLKIDQSFVRNLMHGANDMALCESFIAMAHKLGLKVIAEGIETVEQRALLVAAGCNYGQGYLFSKPLPAEEFELLLQLPRLQSPLPPAEEDQGEGDDRSRSGIAG